MKCLFKEWLLDLPLLPNSKSTCFLIGGCKKSARFKGACR